MPDIKELLKIAEAKQNKKFSRGNRPDTLVNNIKIENEEQKDKLIELNKQEAPSVASTHKDHSEHSPIKNNPTKPILEFSNNSVTKAEQFRNKVDIDSVTIVEQKRNNSVTNNSKFNNEINDGGFNSATIAEQFRNKVDIDSVTIVEQKRNNSVTKVVRPENSKKKAEQFRNNSVTENVTNSVTIVEQKRNNSVTNRHISLNELSGNKLKIILTIFNFCHEKGAMETGPISKDMFALNTGLNSEVIRTTANRLISEGYIERVSSKRGVSGYSNYRLFNKIYNECLNNLFRNNSVTKAEQFRNNSVTESVTESVTTPPSKLVSNINNTNYLTEEADTKSTQTQDLAVAQNSGWFKTLDFSALTYIKPMMVNSAIRSLVESKLDQDDVQMFVNKFKNWLATQRNIQNPLAIFCDKLKEYANEGDSPVLGVMSDQELQIELHMAQELEKSRLELEFVNKARLFKAEQEKEARFQNWLLQASDDEKKALYPETGFARIGSEIYNIGLKEAFFNQKQIEG